MIRLLPFILAGVLAGAAAARLRGRPDPFEGSVIGLAPDPAADYLPENRRIAATDAAALERMVFGR